MDTTCTIDETDSRILSALISMNYASRRELGRHLGLPSSTIDGRIKRLMHSGVIVDFIYLVNPYRFNMQTYKLLVNAKGINQALKHSLYKFCVKHPNTTILIQCIGNWDFEISVEVNNASDVVDITQELYQEFGHSINHIEALPQFSELKIACYPFLKQNFNAMQVANS